MADYAREVIEHRTEHDTLIREYPNHIPPQVCDMICDYTDRIEAGQERGDIHQDNDTFIRKDIQYWMTEDCNPRLRNSILKGWGKLMKNQYLNEFTQLGLNDFWMSAVKIQKTYAGGGFHRWHYDNNGFVVMEREFVITSYLNDVHNGGETEFLYQGVRVKPEKGKTVVFPAGYTHMHRGNPPIGGTKYIATTWGNRIPRIDDRTEDPSMGHYIRPADHIIDQYGAGGYG
jgi:hypothetical protein